MNVVVFAAASAFSLFQIKRREDDEVPNNSRIFAPNEVETPTKSSNAPSLRQHSSSLSLSPGSDTTSLSDTASLSVLSSSPGVLSTKASTTFSPPSTVVAFEPLPLIVLLEAAGGTDKDEATGHRRDTIPIRDALLNTQQCNVSVLQYQEEDDAHILAQAAAGKRSIQEQRQVAMSDNWILTNETLKQPHLAGIIVRVNPGTLSAATQAKLDDILIELDKRGIKILSHPHVQRNMGAKDALCKIKHLNCGLEDTDVYYTAQELSEGFRKSIAFRPRVLKQNRGSQGEGIWICKLKDETQYCDKFGDKIADLDTSLILMEANDNHVEEHTVDEFLEFCINGRTETSGTWISSGRGKYLEGGIQAGAMLVDQRFLPRIVEGEVRCLMVGSNLVELVHKKPRDGGLSATLQSGAVYTTYAPDAPKFANLVSNFHQDLPHMMKAFGMEDQPLPLLWTADYIFGDKDAAGKDTFFIGEFNCSCVGITRGLDRAAIVASTAIETVVEKKK